MTCHHVDGQHTATQRAAILTDLAHPPHDGWTVISNVRCLGEGIDVPAVDSVVFTHPKGSTTEIIQAVGRALRRNPTGSGIATILVPVLVSADTSANAQAVTDGYHTIWQVVRALRAHDETLAATLDEQRQYPSAARVLPQQIVVRLPDDYDVEQYLRHLTVRLVTATTSPWWEGYGAAVRYHGAHKHLHVPIDHITDDGYPLGQWIHLQRKTCRAGHLDPQRMQALDTLGMLWDPRATRWEKGAIHAGTYRARHGHLRVPVEFHTDDGYPSARGSACNAAPTTPAPSTPHARKPYNASASSGTPTRRCGTAASATPPHTMPNTATCAFPPITPAPTDTASANSSSRNACSANAAPSAQSGSPTSTPST